jgi:transposase-like protein
MNIHKNARLTFARRLEVVREVIERKQPLAATAAAHAVSVPTVRKWVGRFLAQGPAGLRDASSRPRVSPRAIAPAVALAIVELRRRFLTQARIARTLDVSPSTVGRVLRRAGLSQWRDLAPSEPVLRYEHAQPGDLLHIDTKKLGRIERIGHRITGDPRDSVDGAGWEYLFVAVDDHARLGFTQMKPTERGSCAAAFLQAGVKYFGQLGVTVRRVLTDNGAPFARATLPPPVESWACDTISPAPTARKPTARRSASFNRRCASGLMASPTTARRSERRCFTAGYTTTTGIARTKALAG